MHKPLKDTEAARLRRAALRKARVELHKPDNKRRAANRKKAVKVVTAYRKAKAEAPKKRLKALADAKRDHVATLPADQKLHAKFLKNRARGKSRNQQYTAIKRKADLAKKHAAERRRRKLRLYRARFEPMLRVMLIIQTRKQRIWKDTATVIWSNGLKEKIPLHAAIIVGGTMKPEKVRLAA